ncbi:MAG: winged helix-turn-helix domain-containing protein [Acidobacteriia bacterium]|nr:winged helix-turn-helix domain-containing protein [Terriglobia bacterium]
MPGNASTPGIIRFGNYEVDLTAGHLRKRGVKVRLRDQSFEVLAILLEHPGEVVTREDLRRRLWPADVFVDFDGNLNTAMARLREALSDSADHPRFIETLPKRGYRFIASLPERPAPRRRLLVLPFANLSGDPAKEYVGDAVAEEIVTELASLAPEHLAVMAWTTAMHYKTSRKEIAQIGRELALDYVVEGSVRPAGDRIGVTVQLIQVNDQTHLWSKRFDAGLDEIFRVRTAVAEAISAQIGIPPARAAKEPTRNPAAYSLYLEGRYHLHNRTPGEMAKAKPLLEQAVARDPEFALAYDALADLCWYTGFVGAIPSREAFSAGIVYALRAIEIDNTLAETHAQVAQFRKSLDYNWPEVQREIALALDLNPASPIVRLRHVLSWLLPMGRVEEAAVELERSLESDPLSDTRFWLGITLWLSRRYDEAIEHGRLIQKTAPALFWGQLLLGMVYCQQGMYAEAIAAHRQAGELSGGLPLMLGWLGLTLAQGGRPDEARAVLQHLHAIAPHAYVSPTSVAWIHLGLGETDSAFEWLDRAIDVRDHMMIPIKTYPFFDPIRSDPRFLALLRKMHLEP